jgi:glycosyltransferase involved in cell wall biosynthesis
MTVHLLVSATDAETEALLANGPRRDFVELARATGGRIHYRHAAAPKRGGWRRFAGPQLRQAWEVAGAVERGDALFADGEHVGLPLLLALAVRRRRPRRVVMLGHLVRSWKRPMFWLASRLGTHGVLVVHSVEQERIVRRWLGSRWKVRLMPYQVDTDYWQADASVVRTEPPLVVAVGSENREYGTLVEAARGLEARVVIAAGSYWAREIAGPSGLPENVTLHTEPLPFAELRRLYSEAAAVVVPLHDVPNQSGITTLLEAMSMGRPVIVSASTGQQECVTGPLVTVSGALDTSATAGRGPHVFGDEADAEQTGLYVPVGDSAALRKAIASVLGDETYAGQLGKAAQAAARRHFGVERFTATLAALLDPRDEHLAPPRDESTGA